MELIVRLANGLDAVLGTERSTTQLLSRCRLQGVCELRADEGRIICVFFWFVTDMEVAVVDSAGRSFVVSTSAPLFSVLLDDVCPEEEDFSLGGVLGNEAFGVS